MFKVILASGSPRRDRILRMLKLQYSVIRPAGVEEKIFKDPYGTVLYNSGAKAQYVYNHVIISNLNCENTIVAGFDTIVYFKRKHIGKPDDLEDAREFLKCLAGKVHKVITGVYLIDCRSGRKLSGTETTEVKFKELSGSEIDNYLSAEYVNDKAGAYDISGYGSVLVEKIKGCYYNVAGFPVYRFLQLLSGFEYRII